MGIKESILTIRNALFGHQVRGAIADGIEELDKRIDTIVLSGTGTQTLTGTVELYAGNSVPGGYFECNGQALEISKYRNLYDVIALNYSPANTVSGMFCLPDLRGIVPVGVDPNQSEFSRIGKTGGAKTHTLSVAEMPAHRHMTEAGIVSSSSFAGSSQNAVQGGSTFNFARGTEPAAGGNQAHNNLQPYVAMKYIIKY